MPERASLPPSTLIEMPPSSVELTLLSVVLRAHMECLSPKKQRLFVKSVMDTFDAMEGAAGVVRLRSAAHDAKVAEDRRAALAWVRGAMAASWQLDALKARR